MQYSTTKGKGKCPLGDIDDDEELPIHKGRKAPLQKKKDKKAMSVMKDKIVTEDVEMVDK
jgi:hypothetical protein